MAKQTSPSPPEFAGQGAVQPRFGEVRIRNRGRLPHWEKESGLYFLTFHLADSLPREILQKITERHRILSAAKLAGAKLTPTQEVLVAEYSPRKIEEYFDRGMGECLLRHPQVAQAMSTALEFSHGKTYRLVAWCIMPNHVHVICTLLPSQNLATVLKSWKLYSARAANRIFGRSGRFWQREYYDRLIRTEGEFYRAVQYVLSNPDRAGLKNWPWVWCAGQETRTTAGLETGAT